MSKMARLVRGEGQKSFVKLFENLAERQSRWTVWTDFVVMSAIAISNTVDSVHREAREKEYMALASKYTKAELEVLAEMLAETVMALEANPNQDFLGEMYMALGLGNEHRGQFFTPYHVCEFMAKATAGNLADQIESQGWISACDPTCGAGALLVAFANECRTQNINFQTSVLFVAQDIDYVVANMCYLQLSLLGCAGYVVVDNTLTNPSTAYDKRGLIPVDKGNVWYMPMYFTGVWHWRRVWAGIDQLMAAAKPAEMPDVLEEVQPAEAVRTTEPMPEFPLYAETEAGQLTLF